MERKEITKAGKKPPLFKSVIALLLWLGMVQFNLALLVSAFFLPLRIDILIPALLVLLRLMPINRNSKFGSKVARFIAKNAYEYFPVTVHIEDEKAFDPDQAYVFGYEPHTIIALGAWALTDRAGYTPFPRIKFLASSLDLESYHFHLSEVNEIQEFEHKQQHWYHIQYQRTQYYLTLKECSHRTNRNL